MNLKSITRQALSPLNKLFRLSGLVLLLLIVKEQSNAQILPPDLYCIKNDTLFWNLPNNNCGPFLSYQIYVSNNKTGPYFLLTSVTNQNQTSFFNSNANGNSLFYYMTSNYNCPGQPKISSDTLDNLIPPIIVIDAVSVVNHKVQINFTPNNTEVLSYIIYKNTPAGTIPIDTIYSGNSYIDQSSKPGLKSEVYYVLAQDLCGNNSLFDKAHYSIYLTNPQDSCSSAISLKWTPYQNWPNGVQEYQVWISKNGAPATMEATVNGNSTTYQLENQVSGDSLCITIKAIQANSSISSVSNEVCLKVKTIWVTIYNTSVDSINNTNLRWKWSSDLPFKSVEITSGNSASNLTKTLPFTLPSIIPDSVIYIDLQSNPATAAVYYQIKITDYCNNNTLSNILSTVFLKTTPGTGYVNKLNWEFPEHDNITVTQYKIHRIIKGQDQLLSTVSPGQFDLTDVIDIDNPDEEFICYYVVAEGIAEILPGITQSVEISSNRSCVGQSGSLFFPNALIPDGINTDFKPVGVFTENGEYNLQIYDRWGKKVFETNDINQAWKGYSNNVALPAGVYAYVAELKQLNGNVIRKKGTVMLIR